MLSVFKVARGREGYYLSTVASRPGPPGGLVEPDGAFIGAAAERLGIFEHPVDAGSLAALLGGADPRTGELLDPAHGRVRVAAFDCTFAPAKSVSILQALGEPEVAAQVRAGHEAAVRDVLGYLDRTAAKVRRSRGGVCEVLPAGGLTAASFLHRTSRAGDPHLHTHLVVANLAEDAGGRWSALDARALYLHASTANLLYCAALRHELSARLGVRFAHPGPHADIAGVDRAVVSAFSTRSADIARELERTGTSGPGAARRAADVTRPPKDSSVPYEAQRESWRERAYRLGVSDRRIAALTPGPVRPAARTTPRANAPRAVPGCPPAPVVDPRPVLEAVALRHAAFRRRDLLAAMSGAAALGAPVAVLEALVEQSLQDASVVEVHSEKERRPQGARASEVPRFPGTPAMRSRGGARIPAGFREQTFTTDAWLELASRRDAALARAVGALAKPGSGRVECDDAAVLARSRAVVGGQVVAFAADSRRAVLFEALTGIPTAPVEDLAWRLGALEPSATVLVAGAEELGPSALGTVLDETGTARLDLHLLSSASLEVPLRMPDPAPGAALGPEGPFSTSAGAVQVVVARDAGEMLEAVAERLAAWRACGAPAIVVTPDRQSAAALSSWLARPGPDGAAEEPAPVVRVVPVARLARTSIDDATRLLVLGPARSLGPRVDGIGDDRRTHVLVGPPGGIGPGSVEEAALPFHLRRELGRPDDLPEARARWREAAALVEGFRSRHRVEDLDDAFGREPRRLGHARVASQSGGPRATTDAGRTGAERAAAGPGRDQRRDHHGGLRRSDDLLITSLEVRSLLGAGRYGRQRDAPWDRPAGPGRSGLRPPWTREPDVRRAPPASRHLEAPGPGGLSR